MNKLMMASQINGLKAQYEAEIEEIAKRRLPFVRCIEAVGEIKAGQTLTIDLFSIEIAGGIATANFYIVDWNTGETTKMGRHPLPCFETL